VDLTESGIEYVYRERAFVYLAKGGKDHIEQDRIDYGIEVLKKFVIKCATLAVRDTIGLGTSALRSADNAHEFISSVKEYCGLTVDVISGREEAELIHTGVVSEIKLNENLLVMDIGGGSVELIASEGQTIIDLMSLPLGISHLRSQIEYSDPMTVQEYKSIKSALLNQIQPIKAWSHLPTILAGASGPFEIIESILDAKPKAGGNRFDIDQVRAIARRILFASFEERQNIKGMPPKRADLALESMMLIDLVIELFPSLEYLIVTSWALKEGYLLSKYF
ncbi:MAG: hypothetical protein HKN09_02635, partial [Saprospiraceae bacterium]|nr:hypothetical protein [Saprospiraceae bacterium]